MPVRAGGILDNLSKRAPVIVIITLYAALVGAWTSAPVWLAKSAAIIVAGLALLLLAATWSHIVTYQSSDGGNHEQ